MHCEAVLAYRDNHNIQSTSLRYNRAYVEGAPFPHPLMVGVYFDSSWNHGLHESSTQLNQWQNSLVRVNPPSAGN